MVAYERELLQCASVRLRSAGIESPQIEARLLLQLAIEVNREALYRGLDAPLTQEQSGKFEDLLLRRLTREPLAYIRGSQEFYGRSFLVNKHVLIPRPESELLVDFVISKSLRHNHPTVIDVCTGSGCIGISIAAELPECSVICSDISSCAIETAKANAELNGVSDKCRFQIADGLAFAKLDSVDIIVSNPPYISKSDVDDLQPEVSKFEPFIALSGGETGYEIIADLIPEAIRVLKCDGWFAMEVGLGQAGNVSFMMSKAGFSNVNLENDLAGIPRIVAGQLVGRK